MKYLNINDYIYKYDLHVLEYHPSVGFYYFKSWLISRNGMVNQYRTRHNRSHIVNLFDRYFQNKIITVKE